MNNYEIGQNILMFRKRKKLTQKALADKVGISWEMVSRYERGVSTSFNRLTQIAAALDTPISQILNDQNKPEVLAESQGSSRIPFFISIPKDFDFETKPTHHYYAAPDWILETHKNAFAISEALFTSKIPYISNKGPIFITPTLPKATKPDAIVLMKNLAENRLEVNYFSALTAKANLVGLLLAQENRF